MIFSLLKAAVQYVRWLFFLIISKSHDFFLRCFDSSTPPRLKAASASAAAAAVVFSGALSAPADGPYTLPDLPYPYEALEPHIDAATMKVLV